MAGDSFQNPEDQANLARLQERLQAVVGELEATARQVEGQVAQERSARRTAASEGQRVARTSSRSAGVIEDAGAIEEGSAALDTRIGLQERLNTLIERQAQLEAEASKVTGGGGVEAAESRYQAALKAQSQAEARQLETRGAYTAGIRSKSSTPEGNAALLGEREAANQQATVTRQETAAARKNLEAEQAAGEARTRIAAELKELQAAIQQEIAAVNAEAARSQAAATEAAAGRVAAAGEAVGARAPLALGPGSAPRAPRAQPSPATAAGLGQVTKTAAAAENDLGSAFSRASTQEAQAIVQMRAHGALTTDFVNQLGRGNVTLRQFGNELGTTIAKFAGWAGAAALTYGALGAITEIGKGALDTSSGIQQLNRTIDDVDAGKAAQQFRDLSKQTDVSVGQASDAVFQFSRTFHNQDDAVQAARLGLAAYQLDNVQLADSVKASTAIVQQYGGGIGQLKDVYNELSAAQRLYNARISDMIPLLQKASGAVRNSGDKDITPLIQLGTYASRVTQLSGSQVGTAFYRGAATFYRNPNNADDLQKSFGIAQGQTFTQALTEALQKAASGNLSSTDATKLSKDIFGPQYGGRLGAIFNPEAAGSLLPRIQRDITPNNTQNSLQHELDIQLQQTNKQMANFVNGLGRLGSALAQAGAFAPLGVALKGANAGLGVVTDFAQILGSLPGPVQTLIGGLVAFRAASAFFSNTRIGQSVGQLPGVRSATNLAGFRPSASHLRDQQLSSISSSTVSALDDQMAGQITGLTRLQAQQAQVATQLSSINSEIADQNTTAAKRVVLQEQQELAIAEQAALAKEQAAKEAELAVTLSARKTTQAQLVGVQRSGRAGGYSEAQRGDLAASYGLTAETAVPEAEGATLSAVAGARLASAQTSVKAALARLRGSQVALGAASVSEAEEAEAVAVGALADVPLLTAAGNSVAAARDGLLGLVDRLGGFNIALIGLPFAYEAFKQANDKSIKGAKTAEDALNAPINSLYQLQQAGQRNLQVAKKPETKDVGKIYRGIPFIGGALSGIANEGANIVGVDQDTGQNKKIGQDETAAAAFYNQLYGQASSDSSNFTKLKTSRTKYLAQLTELRGHALAYADQDPNGHVAAQAIDAFDKAIANLQAQSEAMRKIAALNAKDPFGQFEKLSSQNIQKQIQTDADRTTVYGAGNESLSLKQSIYAYTFLAARLRNSTSSTDLQSLATAQRNVVNAATKNAQDAIHAASVATTAGGENSALNVGIGDIKQGQQAIADALAAIKTKFAKYPAIIKAAEEALGQLSAQLSDTLQQIVTQKLDVVQASGDLRTSEIGGTSPESDISRQISDLQTAKSKLAVARATPGTSATTIAGLMKDVNDQEQAIIKSQVSNARSIVQAQGQLAASSIGGSSPESDIARAQQAIANDQRLLDFDRSNGAGTAAIISDQAQLAADSNALTKSIQQNARDIIDASGSLAESRTQDPIVIARIELQTAQKLLAYDERTNAGTAAIDKDKADVNAKRVALANARLQQAQSTIEYNAAVGKIDPETEVQQLEKLVQQMKKLHEPLAAVQRIQEEIYNLQHGTAGDLNLNLGNIHVPSVYEVRSALQAGKHSRRNATTRDALAHINQDIKVNVIVDRNADVRRVVDAIDGALNSNINGVAKAAGLI